jgi:hypothetical protein
MTGSQDLIYDDALQTIAFYGPTGPVIGLTGNNNMAIAFSGATGTADRGVLDLVNTDAGDITGGSWGVSKYVKVRINGADYYFQMWQPTAGSSWVQQ